MRWLVAAFVSIAVAIVVACSSSDLPNGCEARCTGGSPPNMVTCVSQDVSRCSSPAGSLFPRCDDGTTISILLCQNDHHAKCKNGSEPKCVVP